MNEPFSRRYNFAQTNEAEITIREEAPEQLRGYLVELAYECNFNPGELRTLLCRLLKTVPDQTALSRMVGSRMHADRITHGTMLLSCRHEKHCKIRQCRLNPHYKNHYISGVQSVQRLKAQQHLFYGSGS